MSDALFSLVAGEGDGAILGLVAGDTAGAAWELGYSAITEQVTVIAYQLIEDGTIDQGRLVESLLELDGAMDEEPVLRGESDLLRHWLEQAKAGSPSPDETPSLDPVGRSGPLGLTFRRDPDALAREVVDLNLIFHTDAGSILGAVALTSAVAASCFGQAGRDLLLGVAEAVVPAMEILKTTPGISAVEAIDGFDDRIRSLIPGYGARTAAEAAGFVTDQPEPEPIEAVLACLLLVAPSAEKAHLPVAEAAKIGGSNLAAAAGAVIGARAGIRAWPWAFTNDTWFAEIGRRLVRGPRQTIDLPIPYAVEQHLISGLRQDQP